MADKKVKVISKNDTETLEAAAKTEEAQAPAAGYHRSEYRREQADKLERQAAEMAGQLMSGTLDLSDISPNNEIMSSKIANARITYSGTGELAKSQRMGWLGKFFNSELWPF